METVTHPTTSVKHPDKPIPPHVLKEHLLPFIQEHARANLAPTELKAEQAAHQEPVEDLFEAGTHNNPIRYEKLDKSAPDYKQKMKDQLNQFGKDAKAGKVLCLSDLMGNAGM